MFIEHVFEEAQKSAAVFYRDIKEEKVKKKSCNDCRKAVGCNRGF